MWLLVCGSFSAMEHLRESQRIHVESQKLILMSRLQHQLWHPQSLPSTQFLECFCLWLPLTAKSTFHLSFLLETILSEGDDLALTGEESDSALWLTYLRGEFNRTSHWVLSMSSSYVFIQNAVGSKMLSKP